MYTFLTRRDLMAVEQSDEMFPVARIGLVLIQSQIALTKKMMAARDGLGPVPLK